jgi:hypothetical protein
MTASRWLYSAAASLIGLSLGCSQSTAPVDSAAVFVLRRVQAEAVPTVMTQTQFVIVRVISDTIRLARDGTGTISGVREVIPLQNGSSDGPEHVAINFHYRRTNNHLEFEFDCPDMATCVPGPHLVADVLGNNLSATWGPSMVGRSPLLYEKVAADAGII